MIVVTIFRPERRNAVDSATAAALLAAFTAFEEDDSASVAVLTGAGGTFCAGADLKALAEGDRRPVTEDGPGPMGPTRLDLSKPVIAAIEGHAVAGGLELALWCDLRVAATDAVLGVYCRRFGVPLVDGGTVRLPRLIGQSHALDLVLTGRGVGGPEALGMGLVEPPGAARARPRGGHRAGPRARRAAPDVHAQRPPLGAVAVGAARARRPGARGPLRRRHHRQRRDAARARRASRPVRAATARPSTNRRPGAGPVTAATATATYPATERMPGSDVVAAFDFDGTLTRGGSVWQFLTADLRARGRGARRGSPCSPSWCAPPCSAAAPPTRPKRRCSSAPWRAGPPSEVARRAADFGVAHYRRRNRTKVRARLDWHRRQGHRVVVVSASPEYYVQAVAARARRGRRGGHPPGGRPQREAHRALRRRQLPGERRSADRLLAVDGGLVGPRRSGEGDVVGAPPEVHDKGRPYLWAYGNSAGDLADARGGRHRRRRRSPGPLRQAAPASAAWGTCSPPGDGSARAPWAGGGPDVDVAVQARRASCELDGHRAGARPIRTTRRGRPRAPKCVRHVEDRLPAPTVGVGQRPLASSARGRPAPACRRPHEQPGHHGQLVGRPGPLVPGRQRHRARGRRCRATPRGPPPRRRSPPPRPPAPGAGPGTGPTSTRPARRVPVEALDRRPPARATGRGPRGDVSARLTGSR